MTSGLRHATSRNLAFRVSISKREAGDKKRWSWLGIPLKPDSEDAIEVFDGLESVRATDGIENSDEMDAACATRIIRMVHSKVAMVLGSRIYQTRRGSLQTPLRRLGVDMAYFARGDDSGAVIILLWLWNGW